MEDEELAKSLLVTQQPGNIRISNGFGSNDTGANASASGVTPVLLLSAFVTAWSAFAGGFVVSTINIYIALEDSCGSVLGILFRAVTKKFKLLQYFSLYHFLRKMKLEIIFNE